MAKMTIEVSRPEDQRLIESLLDRLGIPVLTEEEPVNGKGIADLMQELSDLQGFNQIEDPAAWQRETRQDRPLPFRDK